jgi:hypothetical protein
VLSTFARKAAGASSARHSLRPLIKKAEGFWANPDAICAAGMRRRGCNARLCVVSAKAGTHNHRLLLLQKASATAPER